MSTDPLSLTGVETVTTADLTLAETVSKVLRSLEPVFRHEGGKARLVAVKDNVARLELSNEMCDGCSAALSGMEGGLRLMLIERVPGLKEVVFE